MSPSTTLNELNTMDLASFVTLFGNLVEYFPVLAASLYQRRPFASTEDLVACAHDIIDALPIVGGWVNTDGTVIGYWININQIKFKPSYNGNQIQCKLNSNLATLSTHLS